VGVTGERHGRVRGILKRVLRNLRRMGNVDKAAGIRAAVPGPAICEVAGAWSYNRSEPGSGRVPGGRRRWPYVPIEPSGQHNRR
jgi:hypothetical protein